MHARRVVLAGMPAAVLVCFSIGSAGAQEPAPAAAPEKPAPITAVLDAGTRSIRLDPMGARIAVPAGFAISYFNSNPNVFALSGDIGGANSMGALDVWFYAGSTCADWAAQSSKGTKLVTPKKGTEFYDSRWHPQYKQSKTWIYFCMDRPGGTISIESPPLKPNQFQPVLEFTTNLADVFVPRTQVQVAIAAAAAAGPELNSSVDIERVFPSFLGPVRDMCDEGRQAQCNLYQSFIDWHVKCDKQKNAGGCVAIGKLAVLHKEYDDAALYYQRACDFGDSDACKEAKKARSKAR